LLSDTTCWVLEEEIMGRILCATRGGETSYRTQDAAIALAIEQSDLLDFFCVVDINFLDKTAAPIVVDAENEVTKMGEFLLLMAKERAKGSGVEAGTILASGEFREELVSLLKQEQFTLVMLGRPVEEGSVFDLESLEIFARGITEETGVEVRII
jgi:hypothetical protein